MATQFMLPPDQFEDVSTSSSSDDRPTCPIRYHDCGNVHNRRLFDVDGFLLVDDDNRPLHVYNPQLRDHFRDGRIRCIRSSPHGYRYFIRNEEQRQRFVYERVVGSQFRGTTYWIYRDNDHRDQIENRIRNRHRSQHRHHAATQ
jgi:hypothetical protein